VGLLEQLIYKNLLMKEKLIILVKIWWRRVLRVSYWLGTSSTTAQSILNSCLKLLLSVHKDCPIESSRPSGLLQRRPDDLFGPIII